ncbi:MAG TPA: PQQ-binding-like beta-propeller repeat protein [Verrucomicrobiae bacterium]|nr:PQQ-binding-like beta-propeller repeat protein [Verrucomicrobiae bacterium]
MTTWYRAAVITLAGVIAGAVGQVRSQTTSHAIKEAPLFTAQQVAHGKTLYAAKCAMCHGDNLKNGGANPLAGPGFAARWTSGWGDAKLTIDDLDFIIRNTMPKGEPGTLRPAEYTAVLTYVLQQNGYQSGGTVPLLAGSKQMKQARLRFGMAQESESKPPPLRISGDPAAVPKSGGPTQEELNHAADSTRNWLYHTHDYAGARYVALDQINNQNAGQLRAVCVFQVGDEGNFQTGPIVYQGTMYITTNRSTLALNATDCRPKWRYSWEPRAGEVWTNNRGVAIKDGYLIRGSSDGYLLALNADTGKLVWAVKAADAAQGETFTMPPLIFEDLILIGPAGSENAVSGWVGAFRLSDGSPVWKFQTVPGATLAGSESWGNPKGIKIGGGAVWTPFSLDPEKGELFVAVSNPAPDLPANLRPGDNRYSDSVVVLDVHTGKLLWYRQMVRNDFHDWDLTQVSPLFEEKINGQDTPLLTTAGKDGFLRTLNRESHEVIYSTPVTTIKNADVPLTSDGVEACPGALGGVEWNGPALNRDLNMLFVNAVDWCMTMASAEKVRYIPGRTYMGGTVKFGAQSQGWLTAIDATTGEVKWKYQSERPMISAVTATKGNVVFTGELTGDFLTLDAQTGKVLYRFNTGGGIGGGVVTYEEAGKQYVAVMSGKPSRFWIGDITGAPTVFLFALP